eukprot:COSAG01_NODE_8866_length_2631_cov_129.957741_3_plen_67_part_00
MMQQTVNSIERKKHTTEVKIIPNGCVPVRARRLLRPPIRHPCTPSPSLTLPIFRLLARPPSPPQPS